MKREDRNPLDVFVMSKPLTFQDDHPNLLLFSIFDCLTNTAMMPTNLKGQLHRRYTHLQLVNVLGIPGKITAEIHARVPVRSNRRSLQHRHAKNLFFSTDLLPKGGR